MKRYVGLAVLTAIVLGVSLLPPSVRVAAQQAPRGPAQDLATAPDVKPAYTQGPHTIEELDALLAKISNWGRWGKDDQRGAMNLVTEAKRRQAASTVRSGIAVSLTRDESGGDPEPGGRVTIKQTMGKPAGGLSAFLTDSYQVSGHNDSMTHIDALCHIWYRGRIYNGYAESDVVSPLGCAKSGLGIHRNGIVTRGLLIDLPWLRGVPYLEPSTPIYAQDLEAWEKKTGLKVTPGDAIFLRTGRWARSARFPEHPNTMTQLTKVGAAGFHWAVGPWFKERGVALAGQDGGAGVFPTTLPGVISPFSVVAIQGLGVTLIVGMDLDEAAATAVRLNRWEFQFMVAPIQVPGGTGSPVHPIAVF